MSILTFGLGGPNILVFGLGVGGGTEPEPVATYSLTGMASGFVGFPAGFEVALGFGSLDDPVVITPSSTGGTFSPTSVTLTDEDRSGTFTFTPSLAGYRTISVSNDGGLTNPTSLDFQAVPTPSLGDGSPELVPLFTPRRAPARSRRR